MRVLSFALAALLLSSFAHAAQENYSIDRAHSFANWSLRHVVAKTSGTFSDITGQVRIDRNDLASSSVDARINMFSVNSSHAKRDAHIVKEDYLDAARFGEMRFVSSKIEPTGSDRGILIGMLTLHGVSREISFPFKLLGFGEDPWGGYRMGMEGHTSIKASDYGFSWPLKPNASVGDEIEITLLIEAVRTVIDQQVGH